MTYQFVYLKVRNIYINVVTVYDFRELRCSKITLYGGVMTDSDGFVSTGS